jgi:hypothetical protein
MKGSWVWYKANGLCEVQGIETMSEILNPHRLDEIKRRLLFEGETVEMAAEREGVSIEWMSAWLEEQYQFQVKSALGWVRRWVANQIAACTFFEQVVVILFTLRHHNVNQGHLSVPK